MLWNDFTLGFRQRIRHWIRAVFLLGETEVDEINHVSLGIVVSNHDICWLEISVNVPLRVDAIKSVHQLESNYDDGWHVKFALLKRLFQLFEIDS